MRGGLATLNPAGGFAGGSFMRTRTITRPPAWGEMFTDSIVFVCANADVHARSASAKNA
jgi:hypothetical protein